MFEFKLPDLGEGVAEGEILKWHVEEGQSVKEDDPLVDIETDKAAVTIPSPRGGVVRQRAGDIGDTVTVGSVLCVIDESGTGAAVKGDGDGARGAAAKAAPKAPDAPAAPAPAAPTPKASAPKVPAPGAAPAAPAARLTAASPASASSTASRTAAAQPARATMTAPPSVEGRRGPVPAAPATRRLARELGIDINAVTGTGPGGRVTPEDVRLHAEGGVIGAVTPGGDGVAVAAGAPGAAPVGGIPFYELEAAPDFEQWGPVAREPLRSIRRKTARRMVTSMVTVPHVAHMDDADVTDLEAYRARVKAEGGTPFTLLAVVVKAVTVGLRKFKMFNASIDVGRQELVYKQYYNIGFAADTPRGLMVPVVKNADQLSVAQIAEKIRELAVKAREGTIEVTDLQGGTFTITNVGALGGTYVVPTINYPECAILGVGRVLERPVVREGKIVPRTTVPLTITFDHRIGDGADAARFMNTIVGYLSDPMSLLTEM